VPQAENDGKKSAPPPASPLEKNQLGDYDFDWDKAIDEWDPTFIAETGESPPEMSGVIMAPPIGMAAPTEINEAAQVTGRTAAPPPLVEAPSAAPPTDLEAAPLPPPPPVTAEAQPPPSLQLEIDLGPPLSSVETTLAMESQEMDRLTSLLRRPEAAQAAAATPVAAFSDGDAQADDFYDNVMVVTQAESSRSARQPAASTPVPSAATPRPSAKTPPTIQPTGQDPIPEFFALSPSARAAAPSSTSQRRADLSAQPVVIAAPQIKEPIPAAASISAAVAVAPVAVTPVVPPPSFAVPPRQVGGGAPLSVRRLPLPAFDILPLPSLTTPGGTAAPEAATRRHFLSLLDAEAAHHAGTNKRRAARLAVAAAHQSEALREPADALDRYRIAFEADPDHRPALRGTRRVLSWPGPTAQPDEATALLEREMEHSTPSERQGLLLLRSELLRSQGQYAEAKQSFQAVAPSQRKAADGHPAAQPGGMAALGGLFDLAAEQSAELFAALDDIIDFYVTHGSLRTVLQIERARLDETSGRDSSAAARYEALFGASPNGSLSTGLGWLRTAARLPASGPEAPAPLERAYQALLGAHLPIGLRSAVRRRLTLSQPATAAGVPVAGEQSADWLVLEDLALSQERAGDFTAAAATYLKLAELAREPLQRFLALSGAGEAYQRAGNQTAASTALVQAQQAAAAADLDYDVIAARTLERLSQSSGRPEDLLALLSLPMGQPPEKAAYAHYLAAKLLLKPAAEGSGTGAALAERQLHAALQARADYAPAVQLLADLLIAAGKHAEAARVLLRAAEAQLEKASRSESILLHSYAEEGARLLARAGEPLEAARVLLRQLVTGPVAGAASQTAALRWALGALVPDLIGRADVLLSEQVAAALAAEADQTPYAHRAAALFYQRGLLLLPHHASAAPTLGPVEQSWQRALSKEAAHGPALLGLHLRALTVPAEALAHSPLSQVLVDSLHKRMELAAGRPEAMLWALRLGAAQEHEAGDAASALFTYKHLRTFAGDHSALLGLEDTLFVTAWRAGQALELIERRLHDEEDPDQRYALLILAGEHLEAQSQSARAAERFAQALELRPGHPVAKAGLVRAYQSAGMLDELSRFTEAELNEATDVQTRVAAYERQALLAMLRGGEPGCEEVISAYRHVLTLDTNNHAAMRALERHYIASVQWGELVHLYEQMGLCATDTTFAVHIHLDRARLRQRLAWQEKGDDSTLTNELENDFRLALYRDRHCLPALRYLLTAALRKADYGQAATLSTQVAEVCVLPGDFPGTEAGDSRGAAVFMTRAAEALASDGRPLEEIIAAYQSAIKYSREHAPALRGLLHYAILQRQFAVAADCAEGLAQHLHDTDERYLHNMLAGVLAQEMLKDLPRAQRAFLAGLRLIPSREEAFERLRSTYAGLVSTKEGALALAELVDERLRNHHDPAQYQSTLRLELAQLLAGPLANRARAKAELRIAIDQAPNHASALYALGKLLSDDKEWAEAVEPLERYAALEQRPAQLVALHLLLAEIYNDHLRNSQRALAHFTKVLQLQPQNQLALSKLADLFMAQQKPSGALPILRRLVKYEAEKLKKIGLYHRIAALSELAGDNRGALEALRQAVDVDPMNMPALGELVRFYERQQDTQSLRILLDRAASRFRPLLRERPRDPAVLQALLQIFLWRKAPELAMMAAGALTSLGHPLSAELRTEVERLPARKEAVRDGLRDPGIDDVLYPSRVAPGFRALFRLLAEPLSKLYGADQKKLALLGVDKRERLPRSGHPIRELANRLAGEMGIPEFDIYVTAAQRTEDGKKVPLCTIEPTDPPALILSGTLLEGIEAERRFFIGGLLGLLKSNLVLPLSLSADDLGLFIGALVRQFVPAYSPLGYAEKRIANEAARVKRAIPSKLHGQLLPHAMECSSESLDFDGIAEMLQLCSHHMGLVLIADFGSAVSALRRKGASADRYIDDLIRFAVSEEFVELRRLVTRT